MKAIKDCLWGVTIDYNMICGYFYWASTADESGFYGQLEGIGQRTKKSAKKEWEKFAKLNEIKKWKYI